MNFATHFFKTQALQVKGGGTNPVAGFVEEDLRGYFYRNPSPRGFPEKLKKSKDRLFVKPTGLTLKLQITKNKL
jgi:hypothetical protein